ncbi:MAG: hypothetical protein ACSLFN_11875 [Candidatus Limnocylindrales bacterium]
MDALESLAPISDRYATLPIAQAFDWRDVGRQLGDGEWYLVAFRSIRKPGADEARLTDYDERAHLEAAAAPGYVHYFRGPIGADDTCLSFCLWTSRAEARAAAGRPDHVEAVSLLNEMYAAYTLEFQRVTVLDGAIAFEPYDPPPVPAALPAPTFADHGLGALPAVS